MDGAKNLLIVAVVVVGAAEVLLLLLSSVLGMVMAVRVVSEIFMVMVNGGGEDGVGMVCCSGGNINIVGCGLMVG